MSILRCRQCGIDIAGVPLLQNVTFALEAGEKVGLVGPNGVGKTTLIRACLNEIRLDQGEIFHTGSYGYLSQMPALDDRGTVFDAMLRERSDLLTINEQMRQLEEKMANDPSEKIFEQYAQLTERFEQNGGYALEAQIRKILTGLGFENQFYSLVNTLSGGQKTRLALAKLLLRNPDLLILDEPTNHLDIQSLEWLEGYLKDYPGSVLVVSHDRYFLDSLVEKIFCLEQKTLKVYPGNYSEYELQHALAEKTLLRENDRLGKKIARLEEYIRRNKAGVNARQARGRETQLHKLQVRQAVQNERTLGISLGRGARSGDRVLQMEGLTVRFGEQVLFQQANLQLMRGDRVALLGKNGVGKTTLLKAIQAGTEFGGGGSIRLGANVKISYYSQEHEDLNFQATVIDEIRDCSRLLDPEIRNLLARYGFQGEEVYKPVKVLSGGEKSRLALCKLFLSHGNLLLLDEPTNHLDIKTRDLLEEALQDYSGTVLIVSHDRYFMNKVVNKVAVLTPQGLQVVDGDYSNYQNQILQEKISLPSSEQPIARAKQYKQELNIQRQNQQRQKRAQKLEAEIAELETELKVIEAELVAVASDYDRAWSLHQKAEEIKQLIDQAMVAWTEMMD